MFTYQIDLEYLGTNFVGWQFQKNGVSVQEVLEKVLSKFLKDKIKVIGSGRTDAGVHAKGQSAHFKTNKKIDYKSKGKDTKKIKEQINKLESKIKLAKSKKELKTMEVENIRRDMKVLTDGVNTVIAKLERAEGTWEMAENLYEVLADKVRQMEYDIKDLNREINY